MKKLVIPKSRITKGLYVYCNACKKKSKTSLLTTSACVHPPEKQRFKAVVSIPGTTSYKSKILLTRSVDEAIIEVINFERDLKEHNYELNAPQVATDVKPQDLVGCILMYLDFLENKNVPSHMIKIRSAGHVKQTASYLKRFVESLQLNGVAVKRLLVRDVRDSHASIFYDYLKDNHSFANRTYNRHIDVVSELFKYLIKIKGYDLKNYFSTDNIRRKATHTVNKSIKIDGFNDFMKVVNKENAVEILSTGERKYHYKPWVKDAFILALLTGVRRDGVVNMKFSDVIEDGGVPICIKVEDYKYNRRNNLYESEEKKYIYVPVTKELLVFLCSIGYENNKGKEVYLIGRDEKSSRATLRDYVSKSFTHFYKKFDSETPLGFKCLRKTYITHLNNFTNNHADLITGHSGQDIIIKSYQDPTVFDKAIDDFSLLKAPKKLPN